MSILFEQDADNPGLSYRVHDGTFEIQTRFSAIIATMKNCVDRVVIEFEAKKGKLGLTDMNKVWKKSF
jgi:hypothetical protein